MTLTDADLAEMLAKNPGLRISPQNHSVSRPESDPSHGASTVNLAKPASKAAKGQSHKPKVDYKAVLLQQCELVGLRMEPEFAFHPQRKFRADWRVHFGVWEGKRPVKITCFVPSSVLVEYEGGLYLKGKRGHTSIAGIQRDIEKSNLAQILGYILIRVAPKDVVSGQAVEWIIAALNRQVICNACGIRRPVPSSAAPF